MIASVIAISPMVMGGEPVMKEAIGEQAKGNQDDAGGEPGETPRPVPPEQHDQQDQQ